MPSPYLLKLDLPPGTFLLSLQGQSFLKSLEPQVAGLSLLLEETSAELTKSSTETQPGLKPSSVTGYLCDSGILLSLSVPLGLL